MKTSPGGSSDSEDAPQAFATTLISAAEVQDQLSRILASPGFRRSARLQRFLRLAVERTLAGETDQLKEYIVGRDVFDRGAKYDPRLDSIVRVEAQRLRRKLREYYQTHGRTDPILITFRPGSYAPAFARADSPHSAPVHTEMEGPAPLTRLDPRTVAVLPFSNLSPEPEQDYFCDGITEDIINALTAISELQVIGRTSMFALKPGPLDPHEIGARLGAGTIVEGTVRKAGELLRVSVKIIDSETRQALWSQVFDRETRDVFSIEDEIARSIAGTLRVTLGSGWPPERSHKAPNTEAYVLYLKGRQAWNQMNQEGYQAAIRQFSRAISLYPAFALPYAGLADTYTLLAMWGMMRPVEALQNGKHAALEALRLDPSSAQAHSSLGLLRFFFDWEWPEGLALMKKAIDLHPSYSDAHQILGYSLLVLERFDEALPALQRAVHLDPLSFRMNRTLGSLYYYQGRTNEAEKWMEAAIALKPDSMESHYSLARLRIQQRGYDAALREALKCQSDPPSALALSILGVSLSHNGDRAGALNTLKRLSEMSSAVYVDPLASAFIHAALGNTSGALECLEASLKERSPYAVLLNVEPLFENLRPDSRFQELVASLKFP